MSLEKSDILDVLDEAASRFEFPVLDNGYIYPVDVRLSAFGDRNRWAIVVEQLGVFNRDPSFCNSVYAFGNCLIPTRKESDFVSLEAFRSWQIQHRFVDTATLFPVDDGSTNLLDPASELKINSSATDLKIRPRDLPVIVQVDEWHHPDVSREESPKDNDFFKSIAEVLSTGDARACRPGPANTHWSNWPGGGTL